ncbi:MAG: RNA methyltransferase [Nitrospinota bacterium]
MAGRGLLDNIYVVLLKPKSPGNIGAVARAMKNMGLSHLRLVEPADHLSPEALMMACGAEEVLRGAEVFETLPKALSDLGYAVGTSRRRRRGGSRARLPREGASLLLERSLQNRVALLFGPEDRGLTNEELALCQERITIPSESASPSLNLAQAVLILCYELFLLAEAPPHPEPRRLAPLGLQEDMYNQMRELMLKIGFLHPQNPEHILRAIRHLLGRAGLDEREVRIIRGFMRQLDWYLRRELKGGEEA